MEIIIKQQAPNTKYRFYRSDTNLPLRKISKSVQNGIATEADAKQILANAGYEEYSPASSGYTLGVWRTTVSPVYSSVGFLETQYGAYAYSTSNPNYDNLVIEDNSFTVTYTSMEGVVRTDTCPLLWKADNDRYLIGFISYYATGHTLDFIVVDTVLHTYYSASFMINLEINPEELTLVDVETLESGSSSSAIYMLNFTYPSASSENTTVYVPSNWTTLVDQTFDLYVEREIITQEQATAAKAVITESGPWMGVYLGGYALYNGQKCAVPAVAF